jgi:uncharacterized coiled-coil DUF342 family protein
MSAPILVTKADLSRELDVDPRRKALDSLEPVAQAKLADGKLVKLYSREEGIRVLSTALKEAAERYANEEEQIQMTTQDTTEKSQFLIQREKIMAARALQDKDIAERTKYTLPAAVNETGQKVDPNKLVVVTDNLETGKTTHRVVALTPQPAQRFTKPAPLTLDKIREQLVDAGNTIDSAKEKYQADTASLDEFYAERNGLKEELRQLLEKVNERQARLRELESQALRKINTWRRSLNQSRKSQALPDRYSQH